MAPKSAHEAARAKAAKEKKILLALALPLVVAVFYAYHTLSKLHHSSAPPVTPAAATTPASSVPTATTAAAATPAVAPVGLATPAPDTGKLNRLAPLLAAKDPFHDQGPRSTGSSSSPSSGSKAKAKATAKRKQAPRKASPPPTAAVFSVNGRLVSVALGSSFPVTNDQATNGIFRLVGLTAKAAKVAVVGGSYASGAHALTLKVDEAVTLVNTADGQRFTLVLFPQGTPAPGVTASATTTTATTTTPGG